MEPERGAGGSGQPVEQLRNQSKNPSHVATFALLAVVIALVATFSPVAELSLAEPLTSGSRGRHDRSNSITIETNL
jgi:hypothetical protein